MPVRKTDSQKPVDPLMPAIRLMNRRSARKQSRRVSENSVRVSDAAMGTAKPVPSADPERDRQQADSDNGSVRKTD
jgi:hypothetical protein